MARNVKLAALSKAPGKNAVEPATDVREPNNVDKTHTPFEVFILVCLLWLSSLSLSLKLKQTNNEKAKTDKKQQHRQASFFSLFFLSLFFFFFYGIQSENNLYFCGLR